MSKRCSAVETGNGVVFAIDVLMNIVRVKHAACDSSTTPSIDVLRATLANQLRPKKIVVWGDKNALRNGGKKGAYGKTTVRSCKLNRRSKPWTVKSLSSAQAEYTSCTPNFHRGREDILPNQSLKILWLTFYQEGPEAISSHFRLRIYLGSKQDESLIRPRD